MFKFESALWSRSLGLGLGPESELDAWFLDLMFCTCMKYGLVDPF